MNDPHSQSDANHIRSSQRVCLITGGASGIGKATAQAFAQVGDVVHIADVSQSDLHALQQESANHSQHQMHFHQVDVSDSAAVDAWVKQILDQHGRVDVLVHCAVHVDWNLVQSQSVEAITRTMSVGFDGMVHCTKAVLDPMIRGGYGRIVYLSSVASTMHLFQGYAAYAALKAATDAWANILRIELRDSPIRIATVRPGIVKDTNLFRRHVTRANLPRLFDWLPATRPESVARTILKATHRSDRTYIVPITYRWLDLTARWFPRLSRWMCRWGTSRRQDVRMRDDTD